MHLYDPCSACMHVVHSIPEVDESVVNDLEHVDHEFESNGDRSIGGYPVDRRWVYSRIQGDWAVFVQSVSSKGN